MKTNLTVFLFTFMLALSCRQQPKDKKTLDRLAVEKAHKGEIATAIEADLQSLKNLQITANADSNALALITAHQKIAISLLVFVLKSAPDASLQNFALNSIQNRRAISSQLQTIKVQTQPKGAQVGVDANAFKNDLYASLQRINTLNNTQEDFVQYALANNQSTLAGIKSLQHHIGNLSLKNVAQAVIKANQQEQEQLLAFVGTWATGR